jgi:hypothetical protein
MGTLEDEADLLSLMLFSEVWQQQDGKWKIMAAHFAHISPFEG